MADIALVFHWMPDAMNDMSFADIGMWRGLALERWNRVHGDKP